VSYDVESAALTKRSGDVLAVDDLTFTINAATITGFLGARILWDISWDIKQEWTMKVNFYALETPVNEEF
jgi:hypothetical protein